MKITILTPMQEEKEKMLEAFRNAQELNHTYEVICCGIGREKLAKGMMKMPKSDLCVLVGFTAIVGKESTFSEQLKKGSLVEVVTASLFGYEGEVFENGTLQFSPAKTQLPGLLSLTSDKFIKSTNLPVGTLINMEDYTFMYLKKPQDFIIRVISDFLPHDENIDFFKAIENIRFDPIISILETISFE